MRKSKKPAPVEWTPARRAALSVSMKKAHAERLAKYGKHYMGGGGAPMPPTKRKGTGPEKWTPQQRKRFNKTMKAKRAARLAAANGSSSVAVVPHEAADGVVEFPLHAIPERAPRVVRARYTRMNGVEPDNKELATDLLRIAVALLKGKL